jgi:hypothetical protein
LSPTLTEDVTERVAALRARLERQHEMLVGVLWAMGNKVDGDVGDHLFRLLGIVAFWQTLPDPSPPMIDQVNRSLDMLRIEKIVDGVRR